MFEQRFQFIPRSIAFSVVVIPITIDDFIGRDVKSGIDWQVILIQFNFMQFPKVAF